MSQVCLALDFTDSSTEAVWFSGNAFVLISEVAVC